MANDNAGAATVLERIPGIALEAELSGRAALQVQSRVGMRIVQDVEAEDGDSSRLSMEVRDQKVSEFKIPRRSRC